MTSSEHSCSVCGERVEPHEEAFCNNCGNLYHLNQRTDLPGRECGQVWINEEHLALEFGCNTCLQPPEPQASLEDVLDISEAAAAAGMSEEALVAAADAGRVAHRKTVSGTYLFRRGDAVAMQGRQ